MKSNGPKHIAFIMDGNGRWARSRLLPRSAGHRQGLKAMEEVVEAALSLNVPYISFFAFSTENWQRPKKEVDSLMQLLKDKLPAMSEKLKGSGARLVFTGDMSVFDSELREIIAKAQTQETAVAQIRGTINICLNYGGRSEIIHAANAVLQRGQMVDEKSFAAMLYTSGLPDPDLLVRTGGEKRISNFMLYQLAYTELYFCDTLWPDFGKDSLTVALEEYSKRSRRFGKV